MELDFETEVRVRVRVQYTPSDMRVNVFLSGWFLLSLSAD